MKTPISELVEDFSLYPRADVDTAHVANIVRALEAGLTLPLIIVEKAGKRIIDGVHRSRAYRQFLGENAVIEVEARTYKDENEMLLDAAALNSNHGLKLSAQDMTRVAVMLQERGVTLNRIAVALHVPESRIEKIIVRVAPTTKTLPECIPGTKQIYLKPPVRWMADRSARVTPSQAEALDRAPGTQYSLLVTQLRDALREGLIDPEDEGLRELLVALKNELAAYIRQAA